MLQRPNINIILLIILSITIAWGLKSHYSRSQADDLDWMLKPTSYLVHMTSGISFEKAENSGYVNHESGIVIAPSCSGINFMIIVFCLSAYMGLKKIENIFSPFVLILFIITVSYSYTLIVNSVRILISIYSFKTGILQTWLSWETVHLLEGVLIYFIFLLIYYSLFNRIISPGSDKVPAGYFKQIKKGLIPMVFYFSITLLVPIISHRGIPQNNGFINYAAFILTVCPVVLLLFFSIKAYCHNLSVRLK